MTWVKYLALFALAMVLASSWASLPAAPAGAWQMEASAQSLQLVVRNAIVINDDTKFTAENGVVSGSGTKADPYIIEGWEIGQFENGSGIDIRDTESYFRIRNVYVYSCWVGVQMNNVNHGVVENSQFIDDTVGIAFFRCDNCRVTDCVFEGSDIAIQISYSDVSQSDNTFINCNIDIRRLKDHAMWELTWVGTLVCAAILIPMVAILGVLIYYRAKKQRPPRKY